MMSRLAVLGLVAVAAPAQAQQATAVDSLVARITHAWGSPPAGGWRTEWSVIRGDSTLLDASTAEISGSERSGIYTITMRSARFAAPTLVARLRVGFERTAVVARHGIARGRMLDTTDVVTRRALVWGAPIDSAPSLLASALGRSSRRVIREGEPIRDTDTEAPPVIVAGDSVTAEVVRDGVRLVVPGFALQNASLGARLSIRLARGRRFAGVATGRNTVRID
jgi:flagella basal body P-ring formation protein FlgA